LIFWGNAQLQAQISRGFTPPHCGSPDAITREQVLRHYRSAQGRQGGDRQLSPPSSYQHPEFHINTNGIHQY
jgi:hypothetical protein